MSYACIERDELDRRGLCDGVPCAPPSLVREMIVEPILEPLWDPNPFYGGPAPWDGGAPWVGSRHGRPGRRPGHKPSWRPNSPAPRRAAGGGQSGPSTSMMRPRGGAAYSMAPGQQTMQPRSAPTTYRASTSYTTTPMRAPQQSYKASGGQTQMRSRGMKGLGQIVDGVSTRWKYATFGLIGLVIAQAWWWNRAAPQVLRLGGY
jgi:hypothetical protein